MTRRRPLAALLLLTGLFLTASPAPSNPAQVQAKPSADRSARLDSLRPPEVRLRKLHLVRPDLIPYPIEYEVVC
ncbi:MAG TPA: hypothetical protein VGI81_21465 [Tepidisphaeraceae bacterium]|jgi:hypothetical protein